MTLKVLQLKPRHGKTGRVRQCRASLRWKAAGWQHLPGNLVSAWLQLRPVRQDNNWGASLLQASRGSVEIAPQIPKPLRPLALLRQQTKAALARQIRTSFKMAPGGLGLLSLAPPTVTLP